MKKRKNNWHRVGIHAISEHPVILLVNAMAVLLLGLYMLKTETRAVSSTTCQMQDDVLTVEVFFENWICSLLALTLLILSGFVPGMLAELIIVSVFFAAMFKPIRPWLCTEYKNIAAVILFAQIFTLLSTATSAGMISLQWSSQWKHDLLLWMDPFQENFAADVKETELPLDKQQLAKEIRCLVIRVIFPLSGISASLFSLVGTYI